jgi:hypothetical protein
VRPGHYTRSDRWSVIGDGTMGQCGMPFVSFRFVSFRKKTMYFTSLYPILTQVP